MLKIYSTTSRIITSNLLKNSTTQMPKNVLKSRENEAVEAKTGVKRRLPPNFNAPPTKTPKIQTIQPVTNVNENQENVRRSSRVVKTTPVYDSPSTEAEPCELLSLPKNVKVIYTKDHSEVEKFLKNCTSSIVGLDCEWKVSFVKGEPQRPVALLQLYLPCSSQVLLLHLVHMTEFPTSLKTFLEASHPKKTGVNVIGDAKKLGRDYNVYMNGILELRNLVGKNISLANLVQEEMDMILDKAKARISNWERVPLKQEQVDYAALDVWAGWKACEHLMKKRELTLDTIQVMHLSLSESGKEEVKVENKTELPQKSLSESQEFQIEFESWNSSLLNELDN